MRKRAALLACAVLAVPAQASGAAAPLLVTLPTTTASGAPPFVWRGPLIEQRFTGRISSRQTVRVGVSATGQPRSVSVLQRLVVGGAGDYVFVVPAPVLDVEPAPGSRSVPGLRADAILWQGFSPGHRELASVARLRLAESAAALPLRVSVRPGGLLLENTTALRVDAFGGRAQAAEVERALQALRRAAAAGSDPGGLNVHATDIRARAVEVDAPLEVEGELAGRRFRAVLGGGLPRRLEVQASPSSRPDLRITVRPVIPPGVLEGRPTLATAVVASLRLSRVRQYDSYLANPDVLGSSQTVYEYCFEPPPARSANATEPSDSSGWGLLGVLALVASGVAALGGLLALWARF